MGQKREEIRQKGLLLAYNTNIRQVHTVVLSNFWSRTQYTFAWIIIVYSFHRMAERLFR